MTDKTPETQSGDLPADVRRFVDLANKCLKHADHSMADFEAHRQKVGDEVQLLEAFGKALNEAIDAAEDRKKILQEAHDILAQKNKKPWTQRLFGMGK